VAAVVDRNQLLRQLLADASSTLDAQGGAVYLVNGAERTLVHATEGWRAGDGVVSLPLRNMHTPVEQLSVKDVTRAGRLLAEFIAGLKEDFVSTLAFE